MCRIFLLFLVVRSPEGDLTLYCKGADTILYELLHPSCESLKEETTEHLNVSVSFFTESLRLVVAFSPDMKMWYVLKKKQLSEAAPEQEVYIYIYLVGIRERN